MRYSDDTQTNEQQKVANGEREIITNEMLADWPSDELHEMLLDILNEQWPVDEAQNTILEVFEDKEADNG